MEAPRRYGTGDSEDHEPETVVTADEDELLALATAIVIVAGLAEEPVESSIFETVVEDVSVVLGISSLAIEPTKQKVAIHPALILRTIASW